MDRVAYRQTSGFSSHEVQNTIAMTGSKQILTVLVRAPKQWPTTRFHLRPDRGASTVAAPVVSKHEDFGVHIDTRRLYNERVGDYRILRPMDILIYKNSDGYSAIVAAFPRIVGQGMSKSEAQTDAIRHLLHSRNFYASLPPERGTPGAKHQSVLMKQYLQ